MAVLIAMTRLTFGISMFFDGFITGPSPRREEPLGDGGDLLHEWMTGLTDMRASHRTTTGTADADVIADAYDNLGALLMGRAMFDVGEEPWGDDPRALEPRLIALEEPHPAAEQHRDEVDLQLVEQSGS